MRLSAVSCLVVIAALFDGADTAKAESDLSTLAGTFWRLDRLDRTSGAVPERASIAALVRREIFHSIVVHISHGSIGFNAPGGVVRGYGFGYSSGSLEIGRRAFGRSSFWSANGFVLDSVEANLPRVAGYMVKGDVLEFLDGHAHLVLALSRITATGLENREWSIDQYFDGANLVTAPREAWITFINNSVEGMPGCCGLTDTYRLSGNRLQVSTGFCISGGWCPAEYESPTIAILKAFREELIVEPDGQRMILRDGQGSVQIVLRPRDS
jgi:hypothetical protein